MAADVRTRSYFLLAQYHSDSYVYCRLNLLEAHNIISGPNIFSAGQWSSRAHAVGRSVGRVAPFSRGRGTYSTHTPTQHPPDGDREKEKEKERERQSPLQGLNLRQLCPAGSRHLWIANRVGMEVTYDESSEKSVFNVVHFCCCTYVNPSHSFDGVLLLVRDAVD